MSRASQMVVLVALLAVSASAASAGMIWVYQDTGINASSPSMPGSVLAAFRGGGVWPVILSEGPSAALLPTGWQSLPSNLIGMKGNAAGTVSTGEIAAAGGDSMNHKGVLVSTRGFAALQAVSVAFDSQGQLFTATPQGDIAYRDTAGVSHSLGRITTSASPNFTSISIAVSELGEVGVVARGGPDYSFAYYAWSSLTQAWSKRDLMRDWAFPELEIPSLAFDSKSRPHIVGANGSTGYALDYDIRQDKWVSSILYNSISTPGRLSIAEDGKGGVGTAFYCSTGNGSILTYAYKPDGGSWALYGLQAQSTDTNVTPGLAYDSEGIPAIAYVGNSHLMLAYDPPVPEPTTLLLLTIGGLTVLRRRRSTL